MTPELTLLFERQGGIATSGQILGHLSRAGSTPTCTAESSNESGRASTASMSPTTSCGCAHWT